MKEILVKKRRKEALESNKFLNIRGNFFYDIDNVKSRKNIAEFERNIKCDIAKIKPDILFCPHPTLDRHATHRKISKSILKIINSFFALIFSQAYLSYNRLVFRHPKMFLQNHISQN